MVSDKEIRVVAQRYVLYKSCAAQRYVLYKSCTAHRYVLYKSCAAQRYVLYKSCMALRYHVYLMYNLYKLFTKARPRALRLLLVSCITHV